MEEAETKIELQLVWKSVGVLSDLSELNNISEEIKNDLLLKGIYLFVKDGFPYYVGTTRASFKKRLREHLNLFNIAGRTLKKNISTTKKEILYDLLWVPGKWNTETKYYDSDEKYNKKQEFPDWIKHEVQHDKIINWISDNWTNKIEVYVAAVPIYLKYKAVETLIQYKLIDKYNIQEKSSKKENFARNWHSLGRMEYVNSKDCIAGSMNLKLIGENKLLKLFKNIF